MISDRNIGDAFYLPRLRRMAVVTGLDEGRIYFTDETGWHNWAGRGPIIDMLVERWKWAGKVVEKLDE